MRQGVDLTPAQMNPQSTLGAVEGAAKSVPFIGGLVEGAQDTAKGQFRAAARRQGLAPGATNYGSMDDLYAGYTPAYDTAKGFPVESSIMAPHPPGYPGAVDLPLADYPKNRGALSRATSDRSIWASGEQRKQADKWLRGQLENLPGKGKAGVQYDSEQLLKLRSNIRDRVRAFRQQAPTPESEANVSLLQAAEQRVTDSLESRLPKSATEKLRATDRQYRRYKQVENADTSARMRGAGEFTPTELARSASKADDPDMWKLANAGKRTFDAGPPPTGARAVTLGIPMALSAAAGAPVAGPAAILGTAALLGATKTGRKLAGGNTKAQRAAKAAAIALRNKAGLQGRDLARLYGTGAGAESLTQFYGE
jgi:hypothetical protein